MAENKRQSRLEQEGIDARKEKLLRNDFQREVNEYDANNDAAKSHDDDAHPWGKGTGGSGHGYLIPGQVKSKNKFDYSQFNTQDGGGSYDKYGRNNIGGRYRSQMINLYGPENEYCENSIDTSKNIEDGQVIIKY